jgi:hypothetical protein
MSAIIVRIFIVLAALFYPSYGAIKSGTTILKMNNAVSFASGSAYPLTSWNSSFTDPLKGVPCSVSIDSLDLFFLSANCGTCFYYCPCELLGSARPFYISKKSIDQIGKGNNLNLNDTAAFRKVASGKNCIETSDSAGCILPSVSPRGSFCPKYQWTQPLPLIVTTAQNNYTVIRLIPQYQESCSPETLPECQTYVASIALQWFMQTDGTTDFRGIFTGVKSTNSSPLNGGGTHVALSQFARSGHRGLFDILGRKSPYSHMKIKKPTDQAKNGILFDEKSGKVLFLFQ